MSSDLYRINFETGEAWIANHEIEQLQKEVDDLKDKIRRGWWYEMHLPPLDAHFVDDPEPLAMMARRVRCEVTRRYE